MNESRFQNIVVIGGSSDIATAALNELVKTYNTKKIRLVSRSNVKPKGLNVPGVEIVTEGITHGDQDSVERIIAHTKDADALIYTSGKMDEVLTPFAQLQYSANVNLLDAMAICGGYVNSKNAKDIVLIGSVAGDRGKGRTLYYGAFKAGLENFAQGLQESKPNINTLLVKPGFVYTKMTEGIKLPKLMTITPEQLAKCIVSATKTKKRTIYSTPAWRILMGILKIAPMGIWRKASS